jgi:hypothetical protein
MKTNEKVKKMGKEMKTYTTKQLVDYFTNELKIIDNKYIDWLLSGTRGEILSSSEIEKYEENSEVIILTPKDIKKGVIVIDLGDLVYWPEDREQYAGFEANMTYVRGLISNFEKENIN